MAASMKKVVVRPGHRRGQPERRFMVEKELGRGTFGVVYKVSEADTHDEFALKTMQLAQQDRTDRARMVSEVEILAQVRHPHIVSYQDAWQAEQTLFLLLELCDDTDVQTYLRSRRNPHAKLPEPLFLDWLAQIASGLQYLHSGGGGRPVILHRDIRPKNILVLSDPEADPTSDRKILKLADFGVAKEVNRQDSIAMSVVGAPHFFSPEMIASCQHGYTCKTDIWSFGITAYYLATLREAITTLSSSHVVETIKDFMMPHIDTNYSDSAKTLIKRMLDLDQSRRPSADDVVRTLDKIRRGHSVDWGWQETAEALSLEAVSFVVHESQDQPPMPYALSPPPSDDFGLDTSTTLTSTDSDLPPRSEADQQRDLRTVLRQLSDDANKNPALGRRIQQVSSRQSHIGTANVDSVSPPRRGEAPRESSQSTASSDWILASIIEYQQELVNKMGEAKFRDTYDCLQTHEERELLKELQRKLGDSFSSLLPYFLALKMLEDLVPDFSSSTLKA